jgi:hypothetical protein
MHDARLLCVAAALLAVMAAPATAQQWKWRDAGGRVTVSDRPPPPTVAERDILQRPGAAPARAPAPDTAAAAPTPAAAIAGVDPELSARKQKADLEEEARKKAEKDAADAKRKAEEQRIAAAKADNCSRARAHLRAIEDGVRLAKVNEKGERVVYDDKIRADEAARARSVINSDCR